MIKTLTAILAATALAFTVGRVVWTMAHIPQSISYSNALYQYTCTNRICDVYMTDTIKSEDNYTELYKLLESADSKTQINIHLSGYGGAMSTVYRLAADMEKTQADTTAVVDGPVYSAHAMIAMLPKHMVISPYALFMFHVPAVTLVEGGDAIMPDDVCGLYHGRMDRRQDLEKKCLDESQASQLIFNRLYNKYLSEYMTLSEKTNMYAGFDIIINAEEMLKRVQMRRGLN